MIFLKTEDEIELMRAANQLVAATLAEVGKSSGRVSQPRQLDRVARGIHPRPRCRAHLQGFPNPYGGPFPGSVCTSVNDVVVHGVPREEDILKEGDIISVDCGTLLNGYNGDSCYTFMVGEVSEESAVAQHHQRSRSTRASPRPLPVIASATSAMPCRRTAKPMATASSVSSSVMASVVRCTKTPRCPTMAPWTGQADQERPLHRHRADDHHGQS